MPPVNITYFNPRSPWGERLSEYELKPTPNKISIHALREESDDSTPFSYCYAHLFQSTLSVRRATTCHNILLWVIRISIHALREESDLKLDNISKYRYRISIHALREESDLEFTLLPSFQTDFNPRSPWGERQVLQNHSEPIFLNFNPRSPWGERLKKTSFFKLNRGISIHALREESDQKDLFF